MKKAILEQIQDHEETLTQDLHNGNTIHYHPYYYSDYMPKQLIKKIETKKDIDLVDTSNLPIPPIIQYDNTLTTLQALGNSQKSVFQILADQSKKRLEDLGDQERFYDHFLAQKEMARCLPEKNDLLLPSIMGQKSLEDALVVDMALKMTSLCDECNACFPDCNVNGKKSTEKVSKSDSMNAVSTLKKTK